jgi:hypothetical protein
MTIVPNSTAQGPILIKAKISHNKKIFKNIQNAKEKESSVCSGG